MKRLNATCYQHDDDNYEKSLNRYHSYDYQTNNTNNKRTKLSDDNCYSNYFRPLNDNFTHQTSSQKCLLICSECKKVFFIFQF
jgi:hypothetical protein